MESDIQKIFSYDSLYEAVNLSEDVEIDNFDKILTELVNDNYIEIKLYEDSYVYCAKETISWSDISNFEDNLKQRILLTLIPNPTTFFILCNTQKGKTKIVSKELFEWSKNVHSKIVSFIIVDNDKTLADQSEESILKNIGSLNVEIFKLSSNSTINISQIRTYIDAYEHAKEGDEYKMPLILALANDKQNAKILELLLHIQKKAERKSLLRYGIIWDEADKTYPILRKKQTTIKGNNYAYSDFIVNNNKSLHRLGFVSATEGELLDEDYPECANAHLYPYEIDEDDLQNYRAFHHEDSTKHIHLEPFTCKQTSNGYAINIIEKYPDYFTTPLFLNSGEVYYRKTIVNSNMSSSDMLEFANYVKDKNMYALTFNMLGLRLYRNGYPTEKFKIKGKKFNEILYFVYKKYKLDDKPIFIIGRRKVDRGLGFHFAPRENKDITISYEGETLLCKNMDSLIWTDMILGKIEDKNTAVQKAGRLAGIIAQSPQYCGELHFWTDDKTNHLILRHNRVVDKANELRGQSSISNAMKKAKQDIPAIILRVEDPRKTVPKIYEVSKELLIKLYSFKDHNDKKDYLMSILKDIDSDFHDEIFNYKCIQISKPVTENSKKKNIYELINAAKNNKPYKVGVPKELENENCYFCNIDSESEPSTEANTPKFCFMVWKGKPL
jgi:hypothetical protein